MSWPAPPRRGLRAFLGIALAVLAGGLVLLAALTATGLWLPQEAPPRIATQAPLPEPGALSPPELARSETAPAPPPAEPEPRDAAPPLQESAAIGQLGNYGKELPRDPIARPKIALIVDDLGLSGPDTRRVIALPAAVTLAMLPYPRGVAELAAEAREAGHELLLHLPMQPDDPAADPGPNALRVDLPMAELDRRIAWNLARFSGYLGVNNHMGSRFSADRKGMDRLMTALARDGLAFVDSRTSRHTVAIAAARAHGIPATSRDIFLDDDPHPEAVAARLAEAEALARRKGSAVLIGHPYEVSLSALEGWIARLPEKGIDLVPISHLVRRAHSARLCPPGDAC